MKTIFNFISADWKRVKNHCRTTVGKEFTDKEPTEDFKTKLLISEHTPIRLIEFDWSWKDIKSWVATEWSRHKFEKFITSQRNDRQDKYDRRAARQDTPVIMGMLINGDAIKFVSRRRLCNKADPATRTVWKAIVDAIGKIDPIVAEACKPECWWNGGRCFEPIPCNAK